MPMLTDKDFSAMEQLLADLLNAVDAHEEAGILSIHDRLRRIHAEQSGLRESRARLLTLRSRIER